jgi:hypothetical protein
LREVPFDPMLIRMQMEVCSSLVKPHQSGFLQTRHGRNLVTRQKPLPAGNDWSEKMRKADLFFWLDTDFSMLLS